MVEFWGLVKAGGIILIILVGLALGAELLGKVTSIVFKFISSGM